MDKDKEKQEISVIGRLLTMELLLVLAGIAFLVTGVIRQDPMPLFWGVMIVGGAVALYFVKKKDWKKHWEEQDRIQQVYKEMKRIEREKKEQEKNNG